MRNKRKVDLPRDKHVFTTRLIGALRLIREGAAARAEAIAGTPNKKRVC